MPARRQLPFAAFWTGIFSTFIGDQVLMFAVPLLVWRLTGSVAQAGLAYFTEWLPRVLFLPFSGLLVDRFGVRRVLIGTDAAKVVACVVAYLLVSRGVEPIAVVLGVFSAALAIGNAQTVVAADALIANTYADGEFVRRQAWMSKADQVSMVLGPVLAALLSTWIGIQELLIAAAAFYLVNYLNLVLLMAGVDSAGAGESSGSALADLRRGVVVVAAFPILLLFSLLASLNNMLIGTIEAAGAAIVTGRMGKPDSYFSLLNVVAGLNGVFALSLVPFLQRRMSIRAIGFCAFLFLCAAGAVVSLADSFWPFLAGFGAVIGSTLLLGVYFRSVRARLVPKEHMGKVVGLLTCINQASLPVTGLVLTRFGDGAGPQAVGLVVTLALFAIGLAVFAAGSARHLTDGVRT
jgi:MFS family permease